MSLIKLLFVNIRVAVGCQVIDVTLTSELSEEVDGGTDSDAFVPPSTVKTDPGQPRFGFTFSSYSHVNSPSASSSSRTDLTHPPSVSSDKVCRISHCGC